MAEAEQISARVRVISPPGRPLKVRTPLPSGVLGGADQIALAGPTIPFQFFRPAEPPLLIAEPAIASAGDEPLAAIVFDPDANDDGVFIALHEIETSTGLVYEVVSARPDPRVGLLGGHQSLHFPLHRLAQADVAPPSTSGTLGGPLEMIADDIVRDAIFRRVVHILRAPAAPALQRMIAEREGAPQIFMLNRSGTLSRPLTTRDEWPSLQGNQPLRTLIFIHGFASDAASSLPSAWIRELAPYYDLLLAYQHPTLSADPLANAEALRALIPADLQLRADLIAHSRGGLVARALVELLPPDPHLQIERLLTCGTPHGGTPAAALDRWDTFVSLAFTSASWALQATPAAPFALIPELLEYLLRAAGTLLGDLPGVAAMAPEGQFIAQLNAPNPEHPVPYAVLSSQFDPASVRGGLGEALHALAARMFLGERNDLIVPTSSMTAVDPPLSPQLAGWIRRLQVSHFNYFDEPAALAFAREFLLGQS